MKQLAITWWLHAFGAFWRVLTEALAQAYNELRTLKSLEVS